MTIIEHVGEICMPLHFYGSLYKVVQQCSALLKFQMELNKMTDVSSKMTAISLYSILLGTLHRLLIIISLRMYILCSIYLCGMSVYALGIYV